MGGLLDRPAWSKTERDVISEWIALDARQRPLGRILRCPLCCYNRLCPVLSYVYFTGFGLVALILLVFFCIMIVRPHLYAKQFVQGSCQTTAARYTGSIEKCSCGTYCESSFPCLEVFIHLSTPTRERYDTCLYYSPSELQQTRCSYRPRCEAFTHRMSDEISRYEHKFAPVGAIYPCLYNPYNPMEVVKRVHTIGDEMVVSVVLWPMVVALTCLMFILITYLICGWHNPYNPMEVVKRVHTIGDEMVVSVVLWPLVVALTCLMFILITYFICGCKPYVCIRHPPPEVRLEARRREEMGMAHRKRKDERSHLKEVEESGASGTQPENYQSGGSLLHEPSELQAIIDKAT